MQEELADLFADDELDFDDAAWLDDVEAQHAQVEGSLKRPLTLRELHSFMEAAALAEDRNEVFDGMEAVEAHYQREGRGIPDLKSKEDRVRMGAATLDDRKAIDEYSAAEEEEEQSTNWQTMSKDELHKSVAARMGLGQEAPQDDETEEVEDTRPLYQQIWDDAGVDE